jgi:Leucine-rich repeat (LRR) protein
MKRYSKVIPNQSIIKNEKYNFTKTETEIEEEKNIEELNKKLKEMKLQEKITEKEQKEINEIEDIIQNYFSYILIIPDKNYSNFKPILEFITIKKLDVHNNNFEIPSEITNLQKLEFLNLGKNNLQNLTKEIFSLSCLEGIFFNLFFLSGFFLS